MTLDNETMGKASNDVEKIHGIFHISIEEGILALFLLGFYLLANFVYPDVTLLILSGMGFALWLVFRASHLAIDGLESLGAFAGLSAYVIGVLSSLASNTPEAVVSALTALRGYTSGSPELVEIAVLSVVMAAGFNIILLGCVVVISSRKTGHVDIPDEVVEDDADLIRWTIVAMAILVIFGIIQYIRAIETSTPTNLILLPSLAGLTMLLSYVLYAIYAIKKKPKRPRQEVMPFHTRRNSAILAILGFVGIFIAGHIFTGSIELAFEHVPWVSFGIEPFQQIVIISMIIGIAGAIPEHGIAILAATKNKANIAIGNTLGGTTQVLLLIIGGVAIFLPLPLDARVILQLATAAGSLWFLLRAMTDDRRIDIYEGTMILLLQAFVFIIILTPLVGAS
jgi:cation:H+ antiporter